MATPPRSQNTSPEFRGDHSFRDVDARDSCFAAEHGGDEPPTPSETPNKSLDLEQSGQNNMLLTSLMQDILSSLSNSCSISGNQDNPAVFADVDTVPGSGVNYQRRYSLPSRFLGVPNSQPYRGGNGGGGGSNSNNFVGSGISRLSRIPEFSPGLMVGSGARMNNTMTDGSRKTDPGSIIGVPFPHAVTSNNPWTPVSNSSSNNNSFYNTGISSSNLPPHSVPHAVAGVAHNITGSGESSVGSGNLTCYLVQFTCGRTDTFYIPHEISLTVSIGDYVVVEADRGEDLGRVIMDNINVPLPRRNSTAASIGSGGAHGGFSFDSFEMPDEGACGPMGGSSQSVLPKKIYRLAAGYEIESLLSKIRDEVNAIAVGQFKVQEWKLPMAITDAEYQW